MYVFFLNQDNVCVDSYDCFANNVFDCNNIIIGPSWLLSLIKSSYINVYVYIFIFHNVIKYQISINESYPIKDFKMCYEVVGIKLKEGVVCVIAFECKGLAGRGNIIK